MRRLIALILLLIVPLQFSWSAAMGVHGHSGGDVVGAHIHDHDYHDGGHSDHDLALAGDTDAGHNNDGHHVSHCHHVFSVIFMASLPTHGQHVSGAAPAHPAARFTSHTPILQDPPPPARA
jgi:hypothetical protein